MKLKIVLGTLVVLLVLLTVAAWLVASHLGSLVKSGVVTFGPKLTKTTVAVDSIDISLFAGSAGVQNLVLGNPEGYQAPSAIQVSHAVIRLVPSSVLSDKVIIRSVEVRSPEITFEGNPLGANNLTQIKANVDATTAAMGVTSTNTAAAAPSGPAKPGKKLEVDDFLISGAKVHAQLTGLINKQITLPLPDIHLTDLGKGPEGITPAELTKEVLSQVTTATVAAVAQSVANLGKDAGKAAQAAAAGILQTSTNAVGRSVDKLKQGLGGLLGK